jgi:hypothetical protein
MGDGDLKKMRNRTFLFSVEYSFNAANDGFMSFHKKKIAETFYHMLLEKIDTLDSYLFQRTNKECTFNHIRTVEFNCN